MRVGRIKNFSFILREIYLVKWQVQLFKVALWPPESVENGFSLMDFLWWIFGFNFLNFDLHFGFRVICHLDFAQKFWNAQSTTHHQQCQPFSHKLLWMTRQKVFVECPSCENEKACFVFQALLILRNVLAHTICLILLEPSILYQCQYKSNQDISIQPLRTLDRQPFPAHSCAHNFFRGIAFLYASKF